ncbi:MAG: hypothetical protein K2Q33_05210, partial [Gammaproteobacteria bacterium]|nr:hypothetical protein [Gammaproteobacteria bacterium]
MRKILIVSFKNPIYGEFASSLSYEWNHFYLGLQPDFDVRFFDFIQQTKEHGKKAMQENLLNETQEFKPDVVVVVVPPDIFDESF